jgi:hypothetical protein
LSLFFIYILLHSLQNKGSDSLASLTVLILFSLTNVLRVTPRMTKRKGFKLQKDCDGLGRAKIR